MRHWVYGHQLALGKGPAWQFSSAIGRPVAFSTRCQLSKSPNLPAVQVPQPWHGNPQNQTCYVWIKGDSRMEGSVDRRKRNGDFTVIPVLNSTVRTARIHLHLVKPCFCKKICHTFVVPLVQLGGTGPTGFLRSASDVVRVPPKSQVVGVAVLCHCRRVRE